MIVPFLVLSPSTHDLLIGFGTEDDELRFRNRRYSWNLGLNLQIGSLSVKDNFGSKAYYSGGSVLERVFHPGFPDQD